MSVITLVISHNSFLRWGFPPYMLFLRCNSNAFLIDLAEHPFENNDFKTRFESQSRKSNNSRQDFELLKPSSTYSQLL